MNAAVYCGTRNLYKDMTTAAKSLLTHSCDLDKIFFLIEDDIFPYDIPEKIQCINISNQTYFTPNGPNYNTSWTYMVLIRAALSKVFPNLDKVLSLDVDTIVNENIDELWRIDLTNYYLAAAREPCKSNKDFMAINMGVALLNLKKLREDKKDDEIIHALNTIQYDYNEQDCIAERCQGFIYELPPDYNISNWCDIQNAKHRKIQHFAAVKNWNKLPMVTEYANSLWYHLVDNENSFGLDIIIPAYNDPEGLRRTLKSLYFSDEFEDIQITVVDDCSSIGTQYLDKITDEFPDINVILSSLNGGPGLARNNGRANTYLPFIMFVDCGDIIPSKYCLYEICNTLKTYTMPDIYQWPWINGEWHTVSGRKSMCTPGVVYRRKFLDNYGIRHNSVGIGSYSNEDVGFNHTCKAILEHIETYDLSPHYAFFELPVYKMVYDKNSITHVNNCEFNYTKQIPGLVSNAFHCIQTCERNGISEDPILGTLNTFMIQLYRDFMFCMKKRPDLFDTHWETLRDFYNNLYSKYENNELNSTYQSAVLSARIKDLQKVCSKRINVNRFLRALKDNNPQLLEF